MTANRGPVYVCPNDRSPLTQNGLAVSCPSCGSSFPVDKGIALLDRVQRKDRSSFDESASQVEVLTPEQCATGRDRAAAFLTQAGVDLLESANILDIGCGFGDLTHGLSSCGRLKNCDLYAIDHSFESLRVLRNSISPSGGNQVYLSTQDASAMCFPAGAFDLIVGSAVLHHILDYGSFLKSVFQLLKPGGNAIFAEPFLPGYLIPTLVLAIAVDQLKLTEADLKRPEFGMCGFIIADTTFRVQHEEDAALDELSDKHYFRPERVSELGYSIGFKAVHLANYERPEFYADFMRHFMGVYGIKEPRLGALAGRYYDIFRRIVGNKLPELVSHFKYIVFTR